MKFDGTITLGTMLHLVISLITALVTVAIIYGTLKAQIGAMLVQLMEIKEDMEKLTDKTSALAEKLPEVERDIAWLKQKKMK